MRHKLLAGFLFAAVFAAVSSTAIASTTWYTNGVSGSDSHNCRSTGLASRICCFYSGRTDSKATRSW
jgi:hypothetical protein